MSLLLIQNKGVAPVEAFTLLGASGSRGNNDLIGQFGSGAKLAITTLLRKGLKVVVYCGLTRLEFKTKVIVIDDGIEKKQEQQVYVQFSGTSRKKVDLGWTLGMGAMDWKTCTDMAIREFVANAIDRTIKQGDSVRDSFTDRDLAVEIVPDDSMRAQSGYTRVFIESDEDCQNYVDDLHHKFLHFMESDLSQQIMPKVGDRRKAQIYYNGVFVRELSSLDDSMCDYNFTGDQIKIDESRNLDEYQARAAIGRLYRDGSVVAIMRLLTALKRGDSFLETSLDGYYLKPNTWDSASTERQKQNWQEAWEKVFGDAIACGRDDGIVGEFARKKGYDLGVIDEAAMLDVVREYGIKGVGDVLNDNERRGRTITAPTFEAIDAVNEVWSWVENTGLIDDKKCPKPKVKGFDELSNAESECLGFYEAGSDTIHIRNDVEGQLLLETALEEVGHYVTGARDTSRDMQNFLLRLTVRWLS